MPWERTLGISKIVGLVALIAAFPPVFFTSVTMHEGMRISFGLLLFYLARGLVGMASLVRSRHRKSILFLRTLAEVPIFFGVIWASIRWIPQRVVAPYEYALLAIGPAMTVLEGVAAMEIILQIGPQFGERIADSSHPVKAGSLDVFSSASIAAVFTLLAVLAFATVVSEHGLLTDSALLTAYVAYDIAWIAIEWTRSGSLWFRADLYSYALSFARRFPDHYLAMYLRSNASRWLDFQQTLNALVWFAGPLTSIHSLIQTLLGLMSVQIAAHLAVQILVFVLAARLFGASGASDVASSRSSIGNSLVDDESDEHVSPAADWLFNVLWPCFGRALLILIYTYAWLLQARRADLLHVPFYATPNAARWTNVVLCLAIYVRHLMLPGNAGDDERAWRRVSKED